MSTKQMETFHQIAAKCNAALAGHPPELQGAVLADLLAVFLAGHQPAEMREEILQLHIDAVRELIPVNVEVLRKRNRSAQ